jgi:single-strand DNA-binding protein
MNDTRITIVGTALTNPERKVLEKSGHVVVNFRVVANVRRQNPDTKEWYDAANFRVRVTCWRRLADNVMTSVSAGDPVIVLGRISTRDWKADTGETRINYEVDALSVGHDLSRGRTKFTKARVDGPTSVIEDEESENRVNGEQTHALGQHPSYEDEGYGHGYDESYSSVASETAEDALAVLREAGLDADLAAEDPGSGGEDDTDEGELVGAAGGSGGTAGRSRRRGR